MDHLQSRPAMADAPEQRDGDSVVLLVGDYDPPTMDYVRAIQSLLSGKGVEGVWACPIRPPDKQRSSALTMAFCSDMAPAVKGKLTCCTVGLDKWLDADGLLSWCQSKYPTLKFKVASMDGSSGMPVVFAGEDSRGDVVKVTKFLRVGQIDGRIAVGSDESRSCPAGVWSLIQSRRYYR